MESITRQLARLSALPLALLFALPSQAAEIRLSLPPDPNALPVFVLEAKQERFLPEDDLKLVSNPAGDPSAMRAMIQARRVDFALFNLIGGVRFHAGGLRDISLVTPWVWRGIYLLQPVEDNDLEELDGQRVLVAPGTSTPPHVVTAEVLTDMGIRPEFVTGGAGTVLMEQLRDPKRAPAGVAAPEPLVSQILDRQEAQDWEQRWEIRLDPAEQLGGEIPLGALWQAHPDVDPEVRQRLVAALDEVANWLEDPANHDEAAAIAAAGYRSFFRMPVPESTFRGLLAAERVRWDTGTDAEMRRTVRAYLRSVFELDAPADLFQR
ncbi:MAG: hypothetical protein ACOCY2_01705 [Guyparkeria sp.]|uniref:hypothetical protein n=1 Tax=Guyparkeria sp. TaxID=2035736 RepID=UPI00397CBB52